MTRTASRHWRLQCEDRHHQNTSAENLWQQLKAALEASAENCREIARLKKPWITRETWILIQQRAEIKSKGLRDTNNITLYHDLSRVNRVLSHDKNSYIFNICSEIEKHALKSEPRDLFLKVKDISRTFQPRSLPITDQR